MSEFLVGDCVVAVIFARGLGTEGKKWPRAEAWLKRCEETPEYVGAVEKTRYRIQVCCFLGLEGSSL